MTRTSAVRAARSVTAVSALTIACAAVVRVFWLAGLDALDSARASGPDAPADLLVVGAAAAGVVLVAWLATGLVLAALAAVPGAVGRCAGAAADRVAPAVVRRLAAAVVGTALVTAVSPAAHADGWASVPRLTMSSISGSSSSSSSSGTLTSAPDPTFVVTARPPVADAAPALGSRAAAVTPAPDPGFGAGIPPSAATAAPPSVPEAPPSRARTAPALGPLGPAPHTDTAARHQPTVTVVQGDSLWVIAARHLGAHATPQQIAREWPRWYAANRTVIGSDANLIHVGQVLTAPSPGATS